jgi:HEAT repeat protein
MFFPARKWVTEERDPQVREVLDRAMTRRTRALVLASLEVAILDRNHNVRVDAVKALKTLRADGAMDAVLDRLGVEANPWVRGEMAEYFGAVGGPRAAEGLLRLVEDDDGGVRHRARLALERLAGQDLGKDPAAWKAWAARAFPPAAPAPAPAGAPPAEPGGPPAAPAR